MGQRQRLPGPACPRLATYPGGAGGGAPALELESFRGEPGDRWLVLGPSGSGKTTLLHLMAGLLRPSQGTVTVAGQNLAGRRGAALDRFRGRHVGIVFQQLNLLPTLTALENLLAASYLAGLPQDRGRAQGLLEELGLNGRARAVVCGDTLTERKPHPMPLLHAAAMLDRLASHCVYVGDSRRDIEAGVLDYQTAENAAGQSMRQVVKVRQGVDRELSKKIVKEVKGSKLKVQAAIQGDKLRVSGKKRDDLQAVIALLKNADIDLPLQYENFRD